MDIEEKTYTALIGGITVIEFEDFREAKNTGNGQEIMVSYIGDDDDIIATYQDLAKEYSISQPEFWQSTETDMMFIVWGLVAILMIVLNMIEVIRRQKEVVVRASLGENAAVIALKAVVADMISYEKKLLTYPRTDSRYLTSNMVETASCVIHLAAKLPPFDCCSNFFPLVEAMISDKDVSDHHAIIPTMEVEKADIKALPLGERNLFLLVCCKLLCASAEPYVYETVTATFDCCGHSFTAKGKRILSEGWREIDRIFRASLKEKPVDGDGGTLPDFTEGQTFDGAEVAVTEHFTQPPKPYSEDTLLSAMENAGKDDIPDEAERKGLGTPATRAAIIEKLVAAGFVERKGKSLIPTKAGINLVTILPEPLTSPMLTAEWEQKLTEIAKGGADPDTFMGGIRTMVQEIVSTYSCISEDGKKLFAPEKESIGVCPRCGQPVYEGKKNFACSDRSCGFVLWKNDRFWTSRRKELTKKMATDLLKKGRTNVKGMWSEKKQAAYDAAVILDDTGGKYINFKLEFPKRKEGVNGRK